MLAVGSAPEYVVPVTSSRPASTQVESLALSANASSTSAITVCDSWS
jgi:hypothetical protein